MSSKQTKKKAIIVDLDGTLTNLDQRVHLVQRNEPNWKEFYDGMGEDKVNAWCESIVRLFHADNNAIILITGRPSNYENLTKDWLARHNIPYSYLYMRDSSDYRSDALIKREIYDKYVKDTFDVHFVLDDRKSVVTMWREIGLTCLQPDWGEF